MAELSEIAEKIRAKLVGSDLQEGTVLVCVHGLGELLIDASTCEVFPGRQDGDPDATVTMDIETLQGLREGTVSPTFAVMMGRISIRGDLDLVGKLAKLMKGL